VFHGGGRAVDVDVGAAGLGDLYGEVADASGRGMDEDPLAGADPGGIDQRLPGGEPGGSCSMPADTVTAAYLPELADATPRPRRSA